MQPQQKYSHTEKKEINKRKFKTQLFDPENTSQCQSTSPLPNGCLEYLKKTEIIKQGSLVAELN